MPGEQVDVLGPLGLTLAHNQGVAFGLASGSDAPLIVFAVLALGFVGFLLARNPEHARGCGSPSASSPAARSAT